MCDDRSHVIRQQTVEAHVAKSQLGLATAKLLLPIGSKGERRMAAANSVLPRVRKRGPLLRKVAPEIHRCHLFSAVRLTPTNHSYISAPVMNTTPGWAAR